MLLLEATEPAREIDWSATAAMLSPWVALLGVIVTLVARSSSERRQAHEAWHRERAFEAYSAMLAACGELENCVVLYAWSRHPRRGYVPNGKDQGEVEANAAFKRAMAQMTLARAAVSAIGSTEVAVHADAVWNAAGNQLKQVNEWWEEHVAAFNKASAAEEFTRLREDYTGRLRRSQREQPLDALVESVRADAIPRHAQRRYRSTKQSQKERQGGDDK